METTGKPKATPQSARCPTTAGGRTPFSAVYNTRRCPPSSPRPSCGRRGKRIVPPAETPAQPTAARVRIAPPEQTPAQPTAAPKPHSFFRGRGAHAPHRAGGRPRLMETGAARGARRAGRRWTQAELHLRR